MAESLIPTIKVYEEFLLVSGPYLCCLLTDFIHFKYTSHKRNIFFQISSSYVVLFETYPTLNRRTVLIWEMGVTRPFFHSDFLSII